MEETPHYSRRAVIVFVDDFDLSTVAALQYARSLRPAMLRVVHFVIDNQQAQRLRAAWPPDHSVPLELLDCPGRRLTRCGADLARHEAELTGAQVTVILPGRSSSSLPGRLWRGRTADKIAAAVGRVPNVAVTVLRRRGPRPRRRGSAGRANTLITPANGSERRQHSLASGSDLRLGRRIGPSLA
jgi:hypothetical protein